MRPIPACPECGEANTRKFFTSIRSENGIAIDLPNDGFFPKVLRLSALICTECGYTELRPHPNDMPKIRQAAQRL